MCQLFAHPIALSIPHTDLLSDTELTAQKPVLGVCTGPKVHVY